MNFYNFLAIVLMMTLSLLATGTQAMQPAPLDGEFQLGGKLEHNGEVTPGTSHLYFSLKGDAAKRLYESLPVHAMEDPCTGYRLKAQGNVGCYEVKAGETYACSFSVNLEQGRVEAGTGGCF